uniref:Extended synaptotagmin-like protein 2a n=1 Tax=Gadus morhua TaxID=8049 RepID=A0A8C5BSU2_GADMO
MSRTEAPGSTGPPGSGPQPPGSPLGPPAPLDMDDEPQSSLMEVSQMWTNFGRTFLLIFPIYVLGYLEFSFSWVLVGLAAFFWWRKNHGMKNYRINRALAFLQPGEAVEKRTRLPTADLPPWVHFPDVERVEWLNKTVKQMWPFICQFVDKLFRETIEPAVRSANPHLSSFCFTKIDLGDKAIRVNGVKVYTENVDKRQIIMDLQISFVGNTEIDVDIKKYYCRAGIKSIQLQGVLRVVMEPLLGDMPLIGALSVFFLKKPLLDINWTGLTNMLDIPGINGLCDSIIQDIIYGYLVLPNRLTIPLVGDDQLAQLRFPLPQAVLRIHLLEARDLVGKDKFLGGLIKGKSDPYCVVMMGNKEFKSKVVHETVHPKWNEVYEVLVYDHTVKQLEIEWFDLEEVATGQLHLKLEYLSPGSTPDHLDQALAGIKAARGQANDGPSSAVLVVFLDSARNLPSGKKVSSDPNPFIQFRVGHKSFDSKIRYKTNSPVWEEAFTFLIHNPRAQELEVEVRFSTCSLRVLHLFSTFSPPVLYVFSTCSLRVLHLFSTCSPLLRGVDHSPPVSSPQVLSLDRTAPSPDDSAPSSVQGGKGTASRRGAGRGLGEAGRSSSNLAISGSHLYLAGGAGGKEPTPSIASDISNPYAEQELRQRLHQLLPNGSGPPPLGEIQLTVRHSSQRNKLVVVVHSCRNLIAFTDHGSDPYVRLYLLPDKRRSGRRKTPTQKKNLAPVYDQTFEFSVSMVELHRRTLDVAVKNGGGLLSKHKGLLGKVLVDLTYEDIAKGWTQWYVKLYKHTYNML